MADSLDYQSTPAFGLLGPLTVRAFRRSDSRYSTVNAASHGSALISTGSFDTRKAESTDLQALIEAINSAIDRINELAGALDTLTTAVNNLATDVSALESRMDLASISCTGSSVTLNL
jgi:hypothetical protein